MDILMTILELLMTTFIQLLLLVGVIIIVGFLLGWIQHKSRMYVTGLFGEKGFLLTAWIGTPIHELGHVLMCILFRHRIVSVQWFPTHTKNGYLGYVQHAYNPESLYQRIGKFFIGIAPMLIGVAALIGLMYGLVPHSYEVFITSVQANVQGEQLDRIFFESLFVSIVALIKSLFTWSNFLSPAFWLFLFLSTCISTHIALSTEDMRGAFSGLVTMFVALFCVNAGAELFQVDVANITSRLGTYNAYLVSFSSVALMFASMTLTLSFLGYQIKRKYSNKDLFI
ncbi:hypothetical protein JOC83_001344 [Bacillus iocasae]|uniref:Integral membrane protein n=1 Tax=Priestia iocasae TaxID=2291674 RepID=A0ABS2QSR7_9BACI|nr:hypothetical protein [Metabacillus iocasae]MBM7702510.1 hypothetical protein [Metabacillus iocasae]